MQGGSNARKNPNKSPCPNNSTDWSGFPKSFYIPCPTLNMILQIVMRTSRLWSKQDWGKVVTPKNGRTIQCNRDVRMQMQRGAFRTNYEHKCNVKIAHCRREALEWKCYSILSSLAFPLALAGSSLLHRNRFAAPELTQTRYIQLCKLCSIKLYFTLYLAKKTREHGGTHQWYNVSQNGRTWSAHRTPPQWMSMHFHGFHEWPEARTWHNSELVVLWIIWLI